MSRKQWSRFHWTLQTAWWSAPAILVMYLHTMIQNLYKLLGIPIVKCFATEVINADPARSSNKASLVQPEGDRRVKKNVWEPKWSRSSPSVIMLESEHGNKRDTASEDSKAKEKASDRKKQCIQRESSGDRWDKCFVLKLIRRRFCRYTSSLVPSTYTVHVVTTDIYLHISG